MASSWLMGVLFQGVLLTLLTDEIRASTIKCVQCTNYREGKEYDMCPKYGFVDSSKVYVDDCEGLCFTTVDPSNTTVVKRGCTSLMSLPLPLPEEDNCYDWLGVPICICRQMYCNAGGMGASSGVRLDEHLQNEYNATDEGEQEGPLQCYECTSHLDDTFYPQCPKNQRVNPTLVYRDNCTGACFTRSDAKNPDKVSRGCTNNEYGLPVPLPKDGCYDWNDLVYCVCNKSNCNGRPIEPSIGKDLDYHLDFIDEKDIVEPDGLNRCYTCINYDAEGNYYRQCQKDKRVRNAYLSVCNGTCFSRTFEKNEKKIARGCTDTQWGLPHPLPPDGCYNWNSEVWCLCSSSRCNGKAIQPSSGKDLDYHLDLIDETEIEEPDGLFRCYQCINYDAKGNYYRQCMKNKRVRNAFFDVCNGTCFTRSYDYDDRKIARGCTSSQWGLPNPLPPDGCYTWYSEVWCVCSSSRCNGRAIGKAQPIEFDAHLPKDPGSASFLQPLLSVMALQGLSVVFLKWLAIK